MSDDGNLDEVLNENLGDFSLMREARSENDEESVAASVSSSSDQEVLSKIAKLAEGQQVLIDVLTQYLQSQKDISAATLSLSSSSSASSPSTPISVIQPTKVSDSQKINSLDWDHVVTRIYEIDYLVSQQAPGTPPIRAGQVLTQHAHELLMGEIRSGTFIKYEIVHGQGSDQWSSLAEMDYITLKSMLVVLIRPENNHQLREKIKQIPVNISEKVLKESMVFSQAIRLNVVKQLLEDIKKFKDLYYPPTLRFFSKSENKLIEQDMKSDFLPVYLHGDNDKENPKSLLKMLEKMLVHDKHVISKAMFESIFSSVTSNEAFVRSLLQTINKIVFEAAAQSGNKETVAELEGTRRTSVGASQVVEVEGATSKFDVVGLFFAALNVKSGDASHPKFLFVGPADGVQWTQGLLNVAFFNIRVHQEFQQRVRELFQKMSTSAPPSRSSLQQLAALTTLDLQLVGEQQLDDALSGNHVDPTYSNHLTYDTLAASFNNISSIQKESLNAAQPFKIENGYSNKYSNNSGGGGRVLQRKTCYKKALRGSCEDANCRFSHESKDIERLHGDPSYVAWCNKVKENSSSNNLELLYQLAVAENENLRQENRYLADSVAYKLEND